MTRAPSSACACLVVLACGPAADPETDGGSGSTSAHASGSGEGETGLDAEADGSDESPTVDDCDALRNDASIQPVTLVIENKVWSLESDAQCEDLFQLWRNDGDARFLLISPDGRPPRQVLLRPGRGRPRHAPRPQARAVAAVAVTFRLPPSVPSLTRSD